MNLPIFYDHNILIVGLRMQQCIPAICAEMKANLERMEKYMYNNIVYIIQSSVCFGTVWMTSRIIGLVQITHQHNETRCIKRKYHND